MKPSIGWFALAPLALLVSFTEIDCSSTTGMGALRLGSRESAPAPPTPSSPTGVLRLLEWCWNERNTAHYREIFTDDFRFVFSLYDESGNAYRDMPWTREDELAMFERLVNGGEANQPPATSIQLVFDRNFRVTDDPRPGMSSTAHRLIRTAVLLRMTYADGVQLQITGFANFFVVRADSASIPLELVERGFLADETRWYVERWEDDTLSEDGLRAQPTKQPTWGSLKARYR